jgi:hypothetical protein
MAFMFVFVDTKVRWVIAAKHQGVAGFEKSVKCEKEKNAVEEFLDFRAFKQFLCT